MLEVVDGEFQNYKAKDGAYVREHFFGEYPELASMVEKMSDADIWRLNRGGHDPHKVYTAYDSAVNHKNQPTVILAHTVKGYGMGAAGEGQNRTHSQKKLTEEEMVAFKNRFNIPLSDEDAAAANYYRPEEGSPEREYMLARRKELGGPLPVRKSTAAPLEVPPLDIFQAILDGSGDREMSTTMAFVRLLTMLTRDKKMGKYVVPIVPDEARTFGMEGMFRQLGIFSSVGQLYEPQDKEQVMFYKEDKTGQILEEGINEAGAFSSWIAAATAYSTHSVNMVPFYIYYSMFGFQRIGDLAWAAGDCRSRGFLIGATAGRTTLAGEGLQHQDGHGMVQAGLIPNCISYDPTYAYEMAVIMHDGMKRMYCSQEDVYYYITAMNESYQQPKLPKGSEKGILKGMYLLKNGGKKKNKVQLLGSGTILLEVIAASELLMEDWSVDSDIWSCTSFNELAREAQDIERWNRLHPLEKAKVPYVTQQLKTHRGPAIAATDYIKQYPEQIRQWIPGSYSVLGTDGFGRSDTRVELRKHFEVDRFQIAVAALKALADDGALPAGKVAEAIEKEIVVPDIGDFDSVEIIEILVAEGDVVEAEDSLITVESDKASMEIPSSETGKIIKLKVALGDNISEGSVILMMDVAEGDAVIEDKEKKKEASTPDKKTDSVKADHSAKESREQMAPAASTPAKVSPGKPPSDKPSPTANIDEKRFSKAYASPSVRKFSRELGVDLGKVDGTSRKGRINKEDVKNFVKKTLTASDSGMSLGVKPMPEIDFSQFGEIENQALSNINKLTGGYVHRSWVTIPHVTQFEDADITEMEAFQKANG
ncbi:Pyruvate dehydrogenase E1 component [Nymphon striatum]|nr:Pyruvate dehydrogenase E1 component [Nymphon striatum]